MRYREAFFLIVIAVLFELSSPVWGAGTYFIKVVYNGSAIAESGLYHKDGIYVPLQALANAMHVPFEWDRNKRTASFNGKPIKGTALSEGGILYVPATTLAENVGAKVKYDVRKKTVIITTTKIIVSTPTPTTGPSVTPHTPPEPFIPISATNDIFKITVTNLETVGSMKGHYTPKPGNKFVITYLSQQNISDEVQIYTGKLALIDSNEQAYDYVEALSNFWLLVLKPGGINFGYLVFEIPQNASPMKIILSTTTRPPLTLNLR